MGAFLSNRLIYRPLPRHIISTGRCNNAADMVRAQNGNVFGSTGWPAVNRAFYVPLHIQQRFTVARFMIANGTAVAGNFDLGLYDNNGTRLVSIGSTLQVGISTTQYVGITDQSFGPGHYYIGIVLSSTGGEVRRVTLDQYQQRACGVLMENLGATTLPTTMTPVSNTSGVFWCFGFTQSDTI